MATLTAGISASATILPVSAEIENGHYTIDSEAIYVHGHGVSRGPVGDPTRRLNVTRAVGGTTAATHLSAATLTRYYPDAATSPGGGGGVTVLEDPGNVWEPATVVAEGYRVSETIEGAARVFEVSTAGTTSDGGAATLEEATDPTDLTPVGLSPEDDGVVWRYLGIIGDLSWTIVPTLPEIVVDPDTRAVSIVNPEPPGESERMFSLDATVDAVRFSVFDAKTDGDADWFLDQNAGAGFRFSQSADGVADPTSGVTEMTTERFHSGKAGSGELTVEYDPFRIVVTGLPTSDPLQAGELYTDGVPSAGVPQALMVSGGPP